jgi:hypothetical protein
VEIQDRLTEETNLLLESTANRVPPYLMEQGWVGGAADPSHPDVIVHLEYKDAGLIGLWPVSAQARHFMLGYIGIHHKHVEGCSEGGREDDPPIAAISSGGLVVLSVPVWRQVAQEILAQGFSMSIAPESEEASEGSIEQGEGGRDPRSSAAAPPQFAFEIDLNALLGSDEDDDDGDEKPDPNSPEGRLIRRAERISLISRTSHIMAMLLGEETEEGWYGKPLADGVDPETAMSDVQALYSGPTGTLLMHPHTDAGRKFLSDLETGGLGGLNYAHRSPFASFEVGPREAVGSEMYPEYTASIISWMPIVLLAEVVAEVTIKLSCAEPPDAPCLSGGDDGEEPTDLPL